MEELNVFSFNSLDSANKALPARIAEIANEIRKETGQTKLNPAQISKIRERLGTWLVDGQQVNWSKVTGFNKIVTGERDKISIKSGIPKETDLKYLTRANLENVTDETIGGSAAQQLKKRIAELDALDRLKNAYKASVKSGLDPNKGNIVTEINKILKRHGQVFNPDKIDSYGWGDVPLKDRNLNGFNKYINKSRRDVAKIAKEIYELTGIEGDIGHGWAALDDKGKRSIVAKMFGTNIGGKYGAENLAWQPRFRAGSRVKMAQLDHWFYSLLSANRPHKQGATAQELADVYVGGKGWQETFDDFLMQGDTNNYFKFSRDLGNMEKSYVLFGREGTPEIRLAQVEQARDFAKSTGAPQNFLDRIDDAGRYIAPTIEESAAKASKAAIPRGGQQLFGGPFKNLNILNFSSSGAGTAVLDSVTDPLMREVIQGMNPFTNPIGAGVGFGIDYFTNQKYRDTLNRIGLGQAEQGDFEYATMQTGANILGGAVTEYATKKAVIPAVQNAWGVLPQGFKSAIGTTVSTGTKLATKVGPYALAGSIGGSGIQGSQRWRNLGYESEAAYIEKMRTHMNTNTEFNPEVNQYDRELVNMVRSYDERKEREELQKRFIPSENESLFSTNAFTQPLGLSL